MTYVDVKAFSAVSPDRMPRRWRTINTGWTFHQGEKSGDDFDAQRWESVELPHTWNASDCASDDPPYRGPAWYRRSLKPDPADFGRRIYLYFEAANQDAAVYVNGEPAGEHFGGFTAFALDVTALAHPHKTNMVEVRLSNAHNPDVPPVGGDLNHFGGLYRGVHLLSVDPVHFDLTDAADGVYIDTPQASDESAKIRVRGFVQNASDRTRRVLVRHEMSDPDGGALPVIETVIDVTPGGRADFEAWTPAVERPQLWSPRTPSLYRCRSLLLDADSGELLDAVRCRFGIRTIRVDPSGGFVLNGEPCFLRGIGKHQDYPGLGYAVPESLLREDVRLTQRMGANFTKTHYPLSRAAYDESDQVGLMNWVRIPIMDKVHHTQAFYDRCVAMTREMIRQLYNHPSIILWGTACEPLGDVDWYWPRPLDSVAAGEHAQKSRVFMENLEAELRLLDDLRPTSNEFHTSPNPQWYAEHGLTGIQSINGWNVYQGWYHDNLKHLPVMLSRIEAMERDHRVYMIAEHGAGSDTRIHTHQPTIFDFSTEYQELFHKTYLKTVPRFPRIAGLTIWTLFDFQAHHQANTMPHWNNKGMLTADRRPKDVYYLMQAHWSEQPMVHIAAAHWTHRVATADQGQSVAQPIRVYSNASSVELFCNGRSLGRRDVIEREATWRVPFIEGVNELRAVARIDGRELEARRSISFEFLPTDLRSAFPRRLCVNLGQSRTFFTDPRTNETWLPDQPYQPGGFGYCDGRYHRLWNNAPAWNGIREGVEAVIRGTDITPVFQTFRVGLTDYRVDCPPGAYQVTFCFTEPFTEVRRRDPAEQTGADSDGRRVFDLLVNSRLYEKELDLAGQFGECRAVTKSALIVTEGGIRIQLRPVIGQPVLSGLKVERTS